eukprot:8509359-Pyramimonas_sp.AAC.1
MSCVFAFSLLAPPWAILDAPTRRETPRPGRGEGSGEGASPPSKGKNGGWKRKLSRPPTP